MFRTEAPVLLQRHPYISPLLPPTPSVWYIMAKLPHAAIEEMLLGTHFIRPRSPLGLTCVPLSFLLRL